MTKNKKCNLPFGLWQTVSKWLYCCCRHRLRSSSQRYHLSPVISGQLHFSHATIVAWGQLQEVGKHTLVDQIRPCARCLRLCTRIRVPRTSVTDILCKQLFQLSNKSLVVHQPTLCALWVHLGHLDKLPTDEHAWTGIITCGGFRRGSGRWGLWRGLTLPFGDFPSWGTSSELEAGRFLSSISVSGLL